VLTTSFHIKIRYLLVYFRIILVTMLLIDLASFTVSVANVLKEGAGLSIFYAFEVSNPLTTSISDPGYSS
jgi:hypothetical protein